MGAAAAAAASKLGSADAAAELAGQVALLRIRDGRSVPEVVETLRSNPGAPRRSAAAWEAAPSGCASNAGPPLLRQLLTLSPLPRCPRASLPPCLAAAAFDAVAPDYRMELHGRGLQAAPVTPDDTHADAWHLGKISAYAAWGSTTGSQSVRRRRPCLPFLCSSSCWGAQRCVAQRAAQRSAACSAPAPAAGRRGGRASPPLAHPLPCRLAAPLPPPLLLLAAGQGVRNRQRHQADPRGPGGQPEGRLEPRLLQQLRLSRRKPADPHARHRPILQL